MWVSQGNAVKYLNFQMPATCSYSSRWMWFLSQDQEHRLCQGGYPACPTAAGQLIIEFNIKVKGLTCPSSPAPPSWNHLPVCRRRQWHPTPVFLPGKSHGWRSLVGCSSWGREELDTTEWLHFHFSLSCVGEGNGNPLQYSCLGNPMDGEAWWAAVHGVAKSRARLSDITFTSHFHALEKEMAPHSSVLAWRISGTEEPSGLPSMGSHRIRHNWSDLAAAAAAAIFIVFVYCLSAPHSVWVPAGQKLVSHVLMCSLEPRTVLAFSQPSNISQ